MEILLHVIGNGKLHRVSRGGVLGRLLQVVGRLRDEQRGHHTDENKDYDGEDLQDDRGRGLVLCIGLVLRLSVREKIDRFLLFIRIHETTSVYN